MLDATLTRPSVFDTFTPRLSSVNQAMYVPRPRLERALAKAIWGTKHVALFGPSGSGKSWLYKQFFAAAGHGYLAVDLNRAPQLGLSGALQTAQVVGAVDPVPTTTPGIGRDPFDRLCARAQALPAAPRVIVFENVEQIGHDADLMRQLASYIMLLDSNQFQSRPVQMLFVGTCDLISRIAALHPDSATIGNRVTVLPAVPAFTLEETTALVQRGVLDRLDLRLDVPAESLARRIRFLASGNAQRIQEICYEVCLDAVDLHKGLLTRSALDRFDR